MESRIVFEIEAHLAIDIVLKRTSNSRYGDKLVIITLSDKAGDSKPRGT